MKIMNHKSRKSVSNANNASQKRGNFDDPNGARPVDRKGGAALAEFWPVRCVDFFIHSSLSISDLRLWTTKSKEQDPTLWTIASYHTIAIGESSCVVDRSHSSCTLDCFLECAFVCHCCCLCEPITFQVRVRQ